MALYYVGILLLEEDGDLKISDIVQDELGGSCFTVGLPRANQSVPEPRFLIVGKDRKFKASLNFIFS